MARNLRPSATTALELEAQRRIALGIPAFRQTGSDSPCDTSWDAAWTVEGDQLSLVDVHAEDSFPLIEATIFASRPFTKIG